MRTRRISIKRQTGSLLPPRASAVLMVLLTIPSLASTFTIRNPLLPRSQVTTASSSLRSEDLLARDSSCGDSSYVQCGSDFPSDFCCPSTSTCMSLAGGTTALCCPIGGNCTQIETIPCELSLEDKSQHPAAVVMTTALTGTLETCGDKCCPFGYSCTTDDVCEEDADQSVKPSTSSVASSAAATASSGSQSSSGASATVTAAVSPATVASGSSVTGSSTASAAAADSSSTSGSSDSSPEDSSSSRDSSAHAGVVAGGVIGGIAAAVCLGLVIMFFVKREMKRKQQSEKTPDDASTDAFGNVMAHPVTRGGSTRAPISKPILHDDGTLRSDFSRKITPHSLSLDGGADEAEGSGAGLGLHHDYYGGAAGLDRSPNARNSSSDGGWTDEVNEDERDAVGEMREMPRSPPGPRARAASSLYGELYRDTTRGSEFQGPLRMPSARAYGGFEPTGAAMNNHVSEYGGGSGGTGRSSPNAAYINVFADENALSPHSLGPPGRFGEGQPGDRETRFSDFGRQI